MRSPEILIIDGKEQELFDTCETLRKIDGVNVHYTVGPEEAYLYLAEHLPTDIAVVNASGTFSRRGDMLAPHLPQSPYSPAWELKTLWGRDVIQCEPEAEEKRLRDFRRECKREGFIAASCSTVVAEIAFLTRVLPGIRPIKDPSPIPKRVEPIRTMHAHERSIQFPNNVSTELRERYESFLANTEAKSWASR